MPVLGDPAYQPREKADVGVRFSQWGESTDRFYTGSSDGLVKVWNIKYAAEDVLIRDLVQIDAGVMCGAFTPDYSSLLLGDGAGGIHLCSLQSLDDDHEHDDDDDNGENDGKKSSISQFSFIPATE